MTPPKKTEKNDTHGPQYELRLTVPKRQRWFLEVYQLPSPATPRFPADEALKLAFAEVIPESKQLELFVEKAEAGGGEGDGEGEE